jgi:hypothetical protein
VRIGKVSGVQGSTRDDNEDVETPSADAPVGPSSVNLGTIGTEARGTGRVAGTRPIKSEATQKEVGRTKIKFDAWQVAKWR